ncbi:globin domain-containing protein [Streptomonospora salina]|uniref:nitric oxide dioxygenase n=1 Tax=Streptomonospora salina TaxID=104205 RepID=A0A841EEF3_9ACTN|nr:globin domain-containing protein [Streptomonospora salina]MBB6000744.1 nitric oxide dioxygenase [Streptomonospora salina]
MLSEESAATVRATLPVLARSLDAVTARFYDTMFADRPELLDGLFNRANQANGEQRRALAGAIAAFASALVDHPDQRPDALLSRIAHKHVSLGVTEDQYVVVHTYLFGAIAHVLGDAATPDVVAAWDEVYWLMAGALIAQEARLYARSGVDGHSAWRRWEVAERRAETDDVVSLALRPADGAPVPEVRPGQYVSVRTRLPDGVHQARQYSVSHSDGERIRITVKRTDATADEPAGEVSTRIHTAVGAGDALSVSIPAGDVTPAGGDRPLVLVSAGIGCTPVVGMLNALADARSTRRVLLLHADRSPGTHALRADTEEALGRLPRADSAVWYEHDAAGAHRQGRMDLSEVALPEAPEVYMCGPLPFMRDVRTQLLRAGVPAHSIHYEVFGPDLWLPDGAPA